jgi:aminoglycoside 6'-N-acetyltransferase I
MMEYRLLGPEDSELLERVEDGVFDRQVQPELTRQFLSDPRHHIAVAIDGTMIVGSVSAVNTIHPDKPDELWIKEIAVAGPYRRRGIAKMLLQLLLELGRELGCKEAWVLTAASNVSANRLYSSLGGVPEKQIMYSFELE